MTSILLYFAILINIIRLSLDASVGISACKAEHFRLAYEVEIPVDSVLEG